jgi:VIT1/CCC1 family predicted Fe2+/Mn2+ transporter/rubrerythrin
LKRKASAGAPLTSALIARCKIESPGPRVDIAIAEQTQVLLTALASWAVEFIVCLKIGINVSGECMAESKTRINLYIALAGEADANRRYTAYGIRALQEGYPEIAQLFLEAAGAETVHAYSHLLALNAIGTTEENLRTAALSETDEIDKVYPRMILEAEAEGNHQAAASFRLALEREKHHQQMFRRALDSFKPPKPALDAPSKPSSLPQPAPDSTARPTRSEEATITNAHPSTHGTTLAAGAGIISDRAAAKNVLSDMQNERERISKLAGIREVVFGSQDGLISTTTLVTGIAATTSDHLVVVIAGAVATLAGALSMTVGSYLSSRAERQLYESELAKEQLEIKEKPGEEVAELIAYFIGRGMSRRDAIEVLRRVMAHPGLMIDMLGSFELGLAPESLGSPVRDALVMGAAFAAGSLIPILPFIVFDIRPALIVTMLLALVTLFVIGAMKARLSGGKLIPSGIEMVLLGGAAGLLGYALGRIVSSVFGISI